MDMNWFVSVAVDKLPLGGDKWVEVKHELSGVEQRRLSAASFTDVQQTDDKARPRIGVDFAVLSLARTKAYLVGWNLTDKEGRPVPFSLDAVEALSEPALKAIEAALDEHVKAVEAEGKQPGTATT